MDSRCMRACGVGLIVVLNACGGREPGSGSTPIGPAQPSNPAPPAAPVIASGPNWSFRVPGFEGVYIIGSLGRGDRLTALEASFDASSSPITAVLNPFGSCFSIDADRARFTGTRSGNTVQLQSEPVNGQVIHLEGTVSSAGDAFDGVYSITGGCGNGASAPIRGRPVNLAGVYVGVMGRIPVTLNMQVASAPDADGNYALSGTARFSETNCFQDAVITRRARGRVMFPDIVSASHRMELFAELDDDLATMYVEYTLTAGTCPELSIGSGRLMRQ